jgi:1-acyl-sn-glycerol-3-phosphate acyltransferase
MRVLRAGFRFLLFFVCTFGLYLIWFVGHFFIPNKVHWRQTIFYLWTLSFVRISRMKVEVIGTPPKPPFFLVANHLGYADIGALRSVVNGVFVAKAEVSRWPVAGRIVRDLGMIFIDRGNRRDIPRAGELIMERLDAGEGVIVFPEGTSTKGEEVLPFNSSFLEFAARSDIAVTYAAISYQTPAGEPTASQTVCWWDDIGFFPHLWRLFKLPAYNALIHFGDSPIMNADRKKLAAELHRRIADNFTPVM